MNGFWLGVSLVAGVVRFWLSFRLLLYFSQQLILDFDLGRYTIKVLDGSYEVLTPCDSNFDTLT